LCTTSDWQIDEGDLHFPQHTLIHIGPKGQCFFSKGDLFFAIKTSFAKEKEKEKERNKIKRPYNYLKNLTLFAKTWFRPWI
jgi:hypothetical protein